MADSSSPSARQQKQTYPYIYICIYIFLLAQDLHFLVKHSLGAAWIMMVALDRLSETSDDTLMSAPQLQCMDDALGAMSDCSSVQQQVPTQWGDDALDALSSISSPHSELAEAIFEQNAPAQLSDAIVEYVPQGLACCAPVDVLARAPDAIQKLGLCLPEKLRRESEFQQNCLDESVLAWRGFA